MYILQQDIKMFYNKPSKENTATVFKLPDTPLGYLQLSHLKQN